MQSAKSNYVTNILNNLPEEGKVADLSHFGNEIYKIKGKKDYS